MVGHIYKDSRLAWLVYFFVIYIVGITLLVCFTMIGEDEYQVMQLVMGIGGCICAINMVVSLLSLVISMQADEQNKWLKFALTLPGGMKTYVRSKYAFSMIMMVAVSILSIVIAGISDLVEPMGNITSMVFLLIAISSGGGMILTSLYAPICFIWGATKGERLLNIVLAVAIIALYCYFMFGDITWLEGDISTKLMNFLMNNLSNILIAGSSVFLAGIILLFISYKFVVFAYEKGWCKLYED